MSINILEARKLYELGFTYRHYQNNPEKGMMFYHNDSEWILGGDTEADLSESDIKIIAEGTWIPSDFHLIEWLKDNDFSFYILNDDGFYAVKCVDNATRSEFTAKTPTLSFALSAVIRKILKKAEHSFDTKEKIYGIIEE